MPIFDQGYQHWQGKLSGHAWRWLAITRQGVRMQVRRRGTKWLVASAFAPALALAGALVIWGLLEQKSSVLRPLMFLIQGLPQELREGPKAFRLAFWTYAFDMFFAVETFFAMLLVLAVGPDLISQDLRFNAMPLYFSRPLRRVDYYLGKLGVIGFFLAAVAIAPAVAAWLLGVAFSLDLGIIRETGRLLGASVLFGSIVVLSAGTLMLAISSLTRNARLVGALWVGLWVVSNAAAGVLEQSVRREWCPVVSYTRDLKALRETLLDTESARAKFRKLWEVGQDTGRQVAFRGSPFGRRRRRPAPPPPPPPPSAEAPADSANPPWKWSAGVLAGLFGISVLTLSTRVKSLDRLK